jgi:hypothetical protein
MRFEPSPSLVVYGVSMEWVLEDHPSILEYLTNNQSTNQKTSTLFKLDSVYNYGTPSCMTQ